ncbi:MAG: hypothetical protein HQL33_00210 [Alphaproteobacteria bacterium]|nr:hypothetical protein [Alphaproteobacteria bacterium]MBF0128394.1 hypothetical protein [Alphaproteobacteria bacterium]
MIGRMTSGLRALLAWTSRPLDEAGWVGLRNRLARWTLALAAVLALQTAVVHSPGYVIGALYHERRVLNLELQAMPPKARAKMLERLCLAEALFRQGGTDPYAIAGARNCSGETAK